MGFSLRFKIIFMTVVILIFAVGATSLASGYVFSQEYADVLQSRTIIIGQGIKSQLNRLLDLGIPLEELIGFEKQLQDTINTYEDIAYAMIVDLDGKILFHNDPTQHNKILTDATILKAVKSEKDVVQVYSDQAGQFYDVFIPIFDRSSAHIGAIRLGFPVELITEKTTRLAVISGVVALVSLGVAIASLVFTLSILVTQPLTKLLTAIQEIRSGGPGLATRVEIGSKDELGELSSAFNTMASQLDNLIDTLEEQVTGRTRQLETVMEISQRVAIILDLNDLLRQVVILTKETFNYYHVHIYLLDKNTELLLLAEGYGQAGAEMKSRGHNIALVAEQSLVAQAAREGRVNTVEDVRTNPNWLPNPLLPDTRSEMAVPVILGNEVVGVLDVQSEKVGGLTRDDEVALRALANQVAVAIQNAHLFKQVETALADAYAAHERYLEQSWEKAKTVSLGGQYLYTQPSAKPLAEVEKQALVQSQQPVLIQSHPVVITPDIEGTSVVAPVTLYNKAIGALQLHTSKSQPWTEDDLAVLEAVADQFAQTAENLRLFEETRQRATREQTIREITDKLRAAPTLKRLVEIATEELQQRLLATHAKLELGLEIEENNGVS